MSWKSEIIENICIAVDQWFFDQTEEYNRQRYTISAEDGNILVVDATDDETVLKQYRIVLEEVK